MKCGKCGADNLDKARFCKQCGGSLAVVDGLTCPACASPCKPGTKFCPRCGQTLSEATVDAVVIVDIPETTLPPVEPAATRAVRPEPVFVAEAPAPPIVAAPVAAVAAPVTASRPAAANFESRVGALPEAMDASSKGPVILVGAIVALLLTAGAAWYWLSAPSQTETPAAPPPVAAAPPVIEPTVERQATTVVTEPAAEDIPAVKAPEPPPAEESAPPPTPAKRAPARKPAADRQGGKSVPSEKPSPVQSVPAPVTVPTPPRTPPTIDEIYRERTAQECAAGFSGTFCRESIKMSLCSRHWSLDPPRGMLLCKQNTNQMLGGGGN